jgi:hypothetical protein
MQIETRNLPLSASWGLGSNGTENQFNKLLDLKPLIGNILRDGAHVRRLLWFGD